MRVKVGKIWRSENFDAKKYREEMKKTLQRHKAGPAKKRSIWSHFTRKTTNNRSTPSNTSKHSKDTPKKKSADSKKSQQTTTNRSPTLTRTAAVPISNQLRLKSPSVQVDLAPPSSAVSSVSVRQIAPTVAHVAIEAEPRAHIKPQAVQTHQPLSKNLLDSTGGLAGELSILHSTQTDLFAGMKSSFLPFEGLKSLRFGKAFLSIDRQANASFPGPCYYTAQVSYGENLNGQLRMKTGIGRATAIGVQLKNSKGLNRSPYINELNSFYKAMQTKVLREVAVKISDSVKSQDLAQSLPPKDQLISNGRYDSMKVLVGVHRRDLMAAIFSLIGRESELVLKGLGTEQTSPNQKIKVESQKGQSTEIQIRDIGQQLFDVRVWIKNNK